MNSHQNIYIAFGSNIDPERNLEKGLKMLSQQHPIKKISALYQTKAQGIDHAPDFLNGVLMIESQEDLLKIKENVLRPIESACGRIRQTDRNAPRSLDLDLCLCLHQDSQLCQDDRPGLSLPDPDILKYAHILVPLADCLPNWIHPQSDRCLEELALPYSQSPDIIKRQDLSFEHLIEVSYESQR